MDCDSVVAVVVEVPDLVVVNPPTVVVVPAVVAVPFLVIVIPPNVDVVPAVFEENVVVSSAVEGSEEKSVASKSRASPDGDGAVPDLFGRSVI